MSDRIKQLEHELIDINKQLELLQNRNKSWKKHWSSQPYSEEINLLINCRRNILINLNQEKIKEYNKIRK